MHSVRFLFLPMVLSLLLSGCAQTRETSSTIFAMNTVMELTAYGDSGQQVLDQATERIYQLEHLLSVTDKNSDISAINHGEGAWVPVSQETFQLLSLALSYGRETQGALDITAYSAVHAWGFTTGEYRVPGPEELAELAGLMEAPMRLEDQGVDHLTLIQQEPLMAVAGIAARKKDGETVSGDAGTYFKRGDGTLYVLLCDGMGSGPQANRESSLALRLLEQFLQAGVETEHALVTLNSALALRGEEAGGFTTVDLLQVDLFTGDGVVFKLGAAPTYVRKGGTVRRISGTSLPAGLEAEERSAPDRFPIHLSPGDCVVLVSDGVTGTEDDSWLRERLVKFDQGSPKELARDLITHSPQGATDDSTALVIRLEKRE